MKILQLKQGTPEWHEARAKHFTASEAAAMMGASSKVTRSELLQMKATGEAKEVSQFVQDRVFAKGHKLEALARPLAEKLIDDELYPATCSNEIEGLPLLASMDGLTMTVETGFEHKQWNSTLPAKVEAGDLDPEHYWQLEHQLLVSEADKILFVCSDGTPDNFVSCWYESVEERRKQLIMGWKQFAEDLSTYTPVVIEESPEGKVIKGLPSLSIQAKGEISASNLGTYEKAAKEYINSINTKLVTDQDFADAGDDVKFCEGAEKELKHVKKSILGQTTDLNAAFNTIDTLIELLAKKRIELSKKVKSEKEQRKRQIIETATNSLIEYCAGLNEGLGDNYINVDADFYAAAKNKRTIKSLQDAIDTELAQAKIRANTCKELYRKNIDALPGDLMFLFEDLPHIIDKPHEDFSLLVESRVSKYREQEEALKAAESVPADTASQQQYLAHPGTAANQSQKVSAVTTFQPMEVKAKANTLAVLSDLTKLFGEDQLKQMLSDGTNQYPIEVHLVRTLPEHKAA